MRRLGTTIQRPLDARCIVGVAPLIHFPNTSPTLPKDKQVERNTRIATALIKRFKGPIPPAYTRKTQQSVEQLEKEVEALLGGASKLRKVAADDHPMDKLTLMERCLRHLLWSYYKDEGKFNAAQFQKWLVYTQTDEAKFNQLKRADELKGLYAAFRKRRAEAGQPDAPVPVLNLEQEYSIVDREVAVEKRIRYDTIAANTTQRDEAQIEGLLKQYRKPAQEKRLDDLVDLLEKFKPVLAREAILQRLTIKHLEGQLGMWRYMDWSPNERDKAELQTDAPHVINISKWEEGRLAGVRLRTKAEVAETMQKTQTRLMAEAEAANPTKSVNSGDESSSVRDQLLKEVLALQARVNKREDEGQTKKAGGHGHGHH